MCSCRWQRDRRDALTWQGTERSTCRQGATRAAQGPDPGLCLPAPQVRPHVTDFADPLGGGGEDQVVLESAEGRLPVLEELRNLWRSSSLAAWSSLRESMGTAMAGVRWNTLSATEVERSGSGYGRCGSKARPV